MAATLKLTEHREHAMTASSRICPAWRQYTQCHKPPHGHHATRMENSYGLSFTCWNLQNKEGRREMKMGYGHGWHLQNMSGGHWDGAFRPF